MHVNRLEGRWIVKISHLINSDEHSIFQLDVVKLDVTIKMSQHGENIPSDTIYSVFQ